MSLILRKPKGRADHQPRLIEILIRKLPFDHSPQFHDPDHSSDRRARMRTMFVHTVLFGFSGTIKGKIPYEDREKTEKQCKSILHRHGRSDLQ